MVPEATYVPGSWVGIAAGQVWLLADLAANDPIVPQCWQLMHAGATIDELLALITQTGRHSLNLAVARLAGSHAEIKVRGSAWAKVGLPDGTWLRVRSVPGQWAGRTVDRPAVVRLYTGSPSDTPPSADGRLLLGSGVVQAAEISIERSRPAGSGPDGQPQQLSDTLERWKDLFGITINPGDETEPTEPQAVPAGTDGELVPPPELPGYRYLRPIEEGSGGYAHVYVYEQASPRREVAVKVLKARRVGETEVRDILDEANAMARLGNHPHIVTVLDARTAADGRPCIIMMYCSGPNLLQLVSRGALDVRRVVRLGIQIADVLHFAHQVHIIHRDIKPANILTDELGNPRLTDFGIAGRVVPGEDADDRAFGVSLPWCPPELVRGEAGSVASDIYSLGATLWHLLVGRSPVDVPGHNTRQEIEHRILHVPAPPTNRRDVPASLENLLARMLAKDPGVRPRSAADVKDELTRIEHELDGPLPSTASWYPTTTPTSAVPSPPPLPDTTRRNRRPIPLLPAAIADTASRPPRSDEPGGTGPSPTTDKPPQTPVIVTKAANAGGHAFISYSRKDSAYVEQLVAYLTNAGVNVWTDMGIEYGDLWARTIDRQLRDCAAFVPVMSRNSREAEWVAKEILLALQLKKPILPLLLDGERFLELLNIHDEDVTGGRLPSPAYVARLKAITSKAAPPPTP